MPTATVAHAEALQYLRALPSASVDAVITDPPYPCIDREYGRWTEAEWFALMDPLVEECRRVLTPTGSAVFILQPNSERVGRMRTWLWEFMAKWGREWGIVQDAYWWNVCAMPEAHSIQGRLLRASLKNCVWMGSPDCHRDQDAVLWGEAESTSAYRQYDRAMKRVAFPSGHGVNRATVMNAADRRGGVSPMNVIPCGNGKLGGMQGHGAATPRTLCQWWVRYICPPGGTVLDPFSGSGTVQLAALAEGRNAIGCERMEKYVQIARRRIAEFQTPPPPKPPRPAWPIDFGDLDPGHYTALFAGE